jgi:pteridine reductase
MARAVQTPASPPGCALVTGSARRLGREIAQYLVEEGWRVVVHATGATPAARAAGELGAVAGLGADLRDLDTCRELVDEAVESLGGTLDLLVNSAATFVRADVRSTTPDQWADAMRVNARAPFFLSQYAAPHLARSERALIANIGDRAAHEHWTSHPVHCASKAALESLTLSAAKAYASDGIRVVGICPGPVLLPDDANPELASRLRQRGPLGTPHDVTSTLAELLADATRTGEIVVV